MSPARNALALVLAICAQVEPTGLELGSSHGKFSDGANADLSVVLEKPVQIVGVRREDNGGRSVANGCDQRIAPSSRAASLRKLETPRGPAICRIFASVCSSKVAVTRSMPEAYSE
jgi:hypothetical protein